MLVRNHVEFARKCPNFSYPHYPDSQERQSGHRRPDNRGSTVPQYLGYAKTKQTNKQTTNHFEQFYAYNKTDNGGHFVIL